MRDRARSCKAPGGATASLALRVKVSKDFVTSHRYRLRLRREIVCLRNDRHGSRLIGLFPRRLPRKYSIITAIARNNISGYVLSWIHAYRANRSQYITILSGERGTRFCLVPQDRGYPIALCCAIYLATMPFNLPIPNCQSLTYANDLGVLFLARNSPSPWRNFCSRHTQREKARTFDCFFPLQPGDNDRRTLRVY